MTTHDDGEGPVERQVRRIPPRGRRYWAARDWLSRNGPATVAMIAQATGVPAPTVQMCLEDDAKKGRARIVGSTKKPGLAHDWRELHVWTICA